MSADRTARLRAVPAGDLEVLLRGFFAFLVTGQPEEGRCRRVGGGSLLGLPGIP